MAGVIDLNADLGEGVTDDVGLLALVTSANVACGYHAGDEAVMFTVCEEALARGVAIGAQVSYDDRANFGRVARDLPFDLLRDQVADQVGVLSSIAKQVGTRVSYVKPHGALYHRVVHDGEQAGAVLEGSGQLPVLGLPPSVLLQIADTAGRDVYGEGFPDRGYTSDGLLVPRGEPGALLEDPVVIGQRAVELAGSSQVSSVCVHGDSPGAVHNAAEVRRALEEAGYLLAPFVSRRRA